MAEHYSRHIKSASSQHRKNQDSVKSKSRSKHYYHKYEPDSKTPPLPTKSTSTLEDLMKQRESLKEELEKMVKYNNVTNKEVKKQRYCKEDSKYDLNTTKGSYEIKKKPVKRKSVHESSPELDNTQVDSEDEETIIKQRRQKRKQLLAKLNESTVKSNESSSNDAHCSIISADDRNNISVNKINTSITIPKQVTDMFSVGLVQDL